MILFEDAGLLALDKPAGRLVICGRGDAGPSLQEEWSERLGRRLYVVHRLDRDTSGVLLFAKTPEAHRAVSAVFESRAARKTYLAAAQGDFGRPRVMDQPLGPFGSGRWGVRPDGKPSRTGLRPLERFGCRATLVEATPRTGRRHQVRVHLYAAGHPVLGDPLYGKPGEWSRRAPRLMLHAWKLSFKLEGRRFEATAPRPADFEAFLDILRR